MNKLSRIGEQIKEARIKQSLTQKQLAKKVGVSEKYIQEVESGTKIINQDILDKIIKFVDAPINDSIVFENYIESTEPQEEFKPKSKVIPKLKPQENEVQEIWSTALSGVLAEVPVFDYDMAKPITTKQLPIISKKIDNHPKDKVIFIKIMDNDMSGFRINKYDMAFSVLATNSEIENNSFYLLEYQGEKMIRQLQKLDNNKILLISNPGTVRTETALLKEITIIAKLLKIEFVL